MKRKVAFTLLTVVLLMQAFTATASALEVKDVAGEFICNCGCNEILTTCEMECGRNLRGFIREQINKGLGKEQIIQYMKVNFKEAILAAPEKKGFNWVAWITPFVVVIGGALMIQKAIHKWVVVRRDDDEEDGGDGPEKPKVDKKYNDRIEQELKEFGW